MGCDRLECDIWTDIIQRVLLCSTEFAEAEQGDFWLSFQKQKQGRGPTRIALYGRRKQASIPGFGFVLRRSTPFAVRRGSTVAVKWDGHHSEQTEKAKRITCAEKYTHFWWEF